MAGIMALRRNWFACVPSKPVCCIVPTDILGSILQVENAMLGGCSGFLNVAVDLLLRKELGGH